MSDLDYKTNYKHLSTMLYRSLERLSLAIEACARIGFDESKPTTNESHGQIWIGLNEAQKDAKLKLRHYQQLVQRPAPAGEPQPQAPTEAEYCAQCHKLIMKQDVNYGINPDAVCMCGRPK